jgi:hypothetical protein
MQNGYLSKFYIDFQAKKAIKQNNKWFFVEMVEFLQIYLKFVRKYDLWKKDQLLLSGGPAGRNNCFTLF